MRLDSVVLGDLSVAYEPRAYIRAMPLLHRATPLGMGFGRTRYASPNDGFRLLYVAEDLQTSVAETLIRDRFEDRRRRRILQAEAETWGAVQVDATAPLTLVDLRTTGLLRLGVSTDAGRAKAQARGRSLSQAIYDATDADGILYRSRLTNGVCCRSHTSRRPGSFALLPPAGETPRAVRSAPPRMKMRSGPSWSAAALPWGSGSWISMGFEVARVGLLGFRRGA